MLCPSERCGNAYEIRGSKSNGLPPHNVCQRVRLRLTWPEVEENLDKMGTVRVLGGYCFCTSIIRCSMVYVGGLVFEGTNS
jgi:hypothetical protein